MTLNWELVEPSSHAIKSDPQGSERVNLKTATCAQCTEYPDCGAAATIPFPASWSLPELVSSSQGARKKLHMTSGWFLFSPLLSLKKSVTLYGWFFTVKAFSWTASLHVCCIIHNLVHWQVILKAFLVSGHWDRCVSVVYSQTQVYFSLEFSPCKRCYLFQLGDSLTRIHQVSTRHQIVYPFFWRQILLPEELIL